MVPTPLGGSPNAGSRQLSEPARPCALPAAPPPRASIPARSHGSHAPSARPRSQLVPPARAPPPPAASRDRRSAGVAGPRPGPPHPGPGRRSGSAGSGSRRRVQGRPRPRPASPPHSRRRARRSPAEVRPADRRSRPNADPKDDGPRHDGVPEQSLALFGLMPVPPTLRAPRSPGPVHDLRPPRLRSAVARSGFAGRFVPRRLFPPPRRVPVEWRAGRRQRSAHAHRSRCRRRLDGSPQPISRG